MLTKTIDLHSHSYYSDGSNSPSEIVQKAKDIGLSALALTDHDAVDGVEEAIIAGKDLDIEIIPAIELNVESIDGRTEILGYFIDHTNSELVNATLESRQRRFDTYRRIVETINLLCVGEPIDFEEVKAETTNWMIVRPHVAKVMLKKGYGNSIKEIIENYLIPGKPAFIQREDLDAKTVIKLVKGAGGLPVLAHPGATGKKDYDKFMREMKQDGIIGIEVYYPYALNNYMKRNPQFATQYDMINYFEDLAKKYNLLATGGSDYHGTMKPDINLGCMNIPYEILNNLKELLL